MDHPTISIGSSLRDYWRREGATAGRLAAVRKLFKLGLEFLRDSLPEQKRRRYGDADYDWDFRVDTTSATVGWRTRLLSLMQKYAAGKPAIMPCSQNDSRTPSETFAPGRL